MSHVPVKQAVHRSSRARHPSPNPKEVLAKRENPDRKLKEVVAEITLKNPVLKKSLMGHGEEDAS